jgi:hypothetical protein
MTPFEVYRNYLALRNHFNSDTYDYFKYQGKGSATVDSFNKRKDRFFFEKVAKHKDPHGFMLANFMHKPKSWIRDIAYSDDSESIYQSWKKRKESLTYLISEDLEKLQFPFDSNFIVKDKQLSYILTLQLGGTLHLETTCVLTDLVGCYNYWNKELKDDVIWQEIGRTIKKTTPFIKYDKDKIKKIVLDFFIDAG